MKKLTLAALAMVGLSAIATAQTLNGDQLSEWRIEAKIYEQINQERTDRGLDRIRYKPSFSYVARDQSDRMANEGELSHTDRIIRRLSSEDCRRAAENVAYTYTFNKDEAEVAEHLVEMWMKSPGHRENLLTEGLDYTGIGVTKTDKNRVYATQNFCVLRD